MSLKPQANTSREKEIPPAGAHVARFVQVIDLGTQESNYQGRVNHRQKILIGWELSDFQITYEDQKEPCLIWNQYTNSMHEKATLRIHLESWRAKQFTPEELASFQITDVIGEPCILNITHSERDGRTYANVNAVMACMEGQKVAPQFHEGIIFDLDNFDQWVFNNFSEGLQEKIKRSPEYKAMVAAKSEQGEEIPF